MSRKRAATEKREPVIHHQTRGDVRALPDAVSQRIDEWNGPYEVRGDGLPEKRAFTQSFPDKPEVELFEVAKPTVDQFR